jgi:hypothetical protein
MCCSTNGYSLVTALRRSSETCQFGPGFHPTCVWASKAAAANCDKMLPVLAKADRFDKTYVQLSAECIQVHNNLRCMVLRNIMRP